jgi:DNA-binding NarL/FixJ family response regulator
MRPVREFALTVALDHGVPTVKTHVSSILTRLDLDNRVQIALALLVHDAGLLDEQP